MNWLVTTGFKELVFNLSVHLLYWTSLLISHFFLRRMNDEARRLFEELGSTAAKELAFRDSWVFVGAKGIEDKSPFEQVRSLTILEGRGLFSVKTTILLLWCDVFSCETGYLNVTKYWFFRILFAIVVVFWILCHVMTDWKVMPTCQ